MSGRESRRGARRIGLALGVCAAVAGAADAHAQEPPEPDERVTISGRVVDQVTRSPLSGVLVEIRDLGVGVETDSVGRFEVRGIRLGVYSFAFSRTGYRPSTGELAVLRPGSFVTAMIPITAGAELAAGRFVGLVTDESGAPIANAEVQIPSAFMGALTREDGRFRFDAVPPGLHRVEFSFLGRATRVETVEVASGLTSDATVRLPVQPIEVDPIEVVVERREVFLEDIGFYERRSSGFGEFIDLEAIEQRAPNLVTDLFTTLPGALLVPSPYNPLERSVVLRGGRLGRGGLTGGGDHCYPMVVIDGQITHRGGSTPAQIDYLIESSAIAGIEVFPSSVGVPVQFGGLDAACGVIVIWSRR